MTGWERVSFAFRCFFSILFKAEIPAEIAEQLCKPRAQMTSVVSTSTTVPPQRPSGAENYDRAIQILSLLQRDGRLIDFLSENISPYPDAQLGAAVRSIHETCRQVLDQYVKLEPILNSEEDQPVAVESNFDAAAIKLIGNVAGQPPLRGMLRHKGWRVKEVNLPQLPQGSGRMIVAPAEIEIS